MPITSSDIKIHLSGGAGNTNPAASLGGVRSTTELVDNVIANLFPNVTGSESAAGVTHYLGIYVKNGHGSITWESVKSWIESQIAGGAVITVGLDPAGVGDGVSTGVMVTIASITTAPAGVTFSNPIDEGSSLTTGDVLTAKMYGIWLKRVVTAGTAGQASDGADLKFKGDSAP